MKTNKQTNHTKQDEKPTKITQYIHICKGQEHICYSPESFLCSLTLYQTTGACPDYQICNSTVHIQSGCIFYMHLLRLLPIIHTYRDYCPSCTLIAFIVQYSHLPQLLPIKTAIAIIVDHNTYRVYCLSYTLIAIIVHHTQLS